MDGSHLLQLLGIVVVLAPLMLTITLGISSLMGWKLSEQRTTSFIYAAIMSGLLAAVSVLGWMLVSGQRVLTIAVGDWVGIPHYHFSIKFVFDRLSVPMAILSLRPLGDDRSLRQQVHAP